jgi:hypothetical protein
MDHLAAGDLEVRVGDKPGCLLLEWRGRSNDRQPGRVLDPWFSALVEEAAAKGMSIEMRFEALEHFNSATITSLIGVVQQARARGVKLLLVYARALKWQKLSFDALRVLGKGDGLLEIRPA